MSKLIDVVIPLAEAHPCEGKRTELLSVMEGTLRKNIMRIQAVHLLGSEPKLANSGFELTRNMIEDVVNIEYMLASKNPEKLAHKFYQFRWVQLREDADYFKQLGLDIDDVDFPAAQEKIEEMYGEVIKENPDFLNKDDRPVRAWARRDVEMMLASLEREKILSHEQIKVTARTYVEGCRKTHFNPVELLSYMEQDTWDATSIVSQKISLIISSASLIRLSTRYIDLISEINGEATYHNIAHQANALLDDLNAVDEISS